ncbi:MAG TPA: C39 family peptidase [Candidatus Paceibacterota bacterium]|nr:C39 family peptidase [Candidatus Paceibacterota bacterium]
MHHRFLRLILGVAVILLAAAAIVPWLVYGSRPDAALVRFWGRLNASFARPGSTGARLSIVFDAQDHALSCEVAALKMALATRGIHVSESELLEVVGFDPTPKQQEGGRIIWGDPQQGFVGNIDGRMPTTGYGVHWEPIARAAKQWRAARAVEEMTPNGLAQELAVGNPVIVWGYLGDGKPYEWQTSDGTPVRTVLHEHTFVVYGYVGTVDWPEGFYLMDPIYGPRYWDTTKLFDRMEKLGYGAVILY